MVEKPSPENHSYRRDMTYLNEQQQLALFNEKTALVENAKTLLLGQAITVWVNINDVILTEIMQNSDWVTCLQRLSFLTLMIEEEFPDMGFGRNNLRLIWLAEKYPLALANLGSGNGSNRTLFDGLFQLVFLGQHFIHNHSQHLSFLLIRLFAR